MRFFGRKTCKSDRRIDDAPPPPPPAHDADKKVRHTRRFRDKPLLLDEGQEAQNHKQAAKRHKHNKVARKARRKNRARS